jgi:hypothetical protein
MGWGGEVSATRLGISPDARIHTANVKRSQRTSVIPRVKAFAKKTAYEITVDKQISSLEAVKK